MITAAAGDPFEAVLEHAPTGLVGTVGVRILDNIGGTTTPRTTAGIIEDPAGTGRYVASLTAPLIDGQYSVLFDTDPGGVATAENSASDDLLVGQFVGIPGPQGPTGPEGPEGPEGATGPAGPPGDLPDAAADGLGPCVLWVDPDTLTCLGSGQDGTLLAAAATQLLWQWSGRLYTGACSKTARPCGASDCFAGVSVAANRWNLSAWVPFYRDAAPPLCGCTPYRRIPLSGYPVQTVDEVTIDGTILDPLTYRLDDNRYLVRTDGGWWPSCQDLRVNAGEVGSFVVSYTAGVDPPASGVLAAAELACWLSERSAAGECELPASTTAVTRQGVTMTLTADQHGAAHGLPLVSAFLDSVNPNRLPRRGAFWSPDVESFAT